VRISVVITLLCALAACGPAPPEAKIYLELVAAPRRGELHFRLANPGPGPIELTGYKDRGVFHATFRWDAIACAESASSSDWQSRDEPGVAGVFTGTRLRVEPGESAEFVVDHMARAADWNGVCRVSIPLEDGTELRSTPFPARRLDGPH